MKKIKVLFISRSVYPLFNPKCSATFGGSEVDVFHISTELAKDNNYQVFCATGNFGQIRQEKLLGVKLIRTYSTGDLYIKKMYLIAKTIIKVKPHYLFLQGSISSTLPIFLLCRIIGTKPVFKFASMADLTKKKLRNPFLFFGLKLSFKIVTQTNLQKIALKNILGLESLVIKNGIRENNLSKRPIKKSIILWVGRSAKVKRANIFIELAKKHPHKKFLMICPKANNNSADYLSLTREARKVKNLRFIKYVPFNQIEEYFEKAICFVNTSLYEGFPNTFVQATMKGVPIISLTVNPDNFLQNNKCGFCANGDIKKLSEIIDINFDKFSHYKSNCINYFKNNHEIQLFIKSYKAIFK